MPGTGEIFEPYLGAPVTSQCYKELGQKIQQYSQSERESLFVSFQPKELHLQLLKLTAARTSGCHHPLLDGLKEECKFVSEFSLNSKLLYDGSNPELFNPTFLIPLLQSVSASTRDRILWRLGKYGSTGGNSRVSVGDMDTLYSAVSKIWGLNIASPLLCQTSKELLERELPNVTSLSTVHLLVIAKKFPFLALAYLEQNKREHPIKAAHYIASMTMPKSFDYIVKQRFPFLTKSMTKTILKNYSDVVLESPSVWSDVFKKSAVKKFLEPEHFELFLTKQFLDMKGKYTSYSLLEYFKLLPPSEVSSILNKVFPEKYGCALRSKLDFWECNEDLLKLLDVSDRSVIAAGLNTKDPLSNRWLPMMAASISMPRIESLLCDAQDVQARQTHLSRLIETALLNKDQSAVEDICKLAVNRYRNDKVTLASFFNSDIKFSSLSNETFDLVFAAAKRFYVQEDRQTHCAAKLFPVLFKRNQSEAGLKEFLDHLMMDTPNCTVSDLDDLKSDFRHICINFLFTTSNIEDKDKLKKLAKFLPLVIKWNTTSPSSLIISDNVKMYVLKLLKSDDKTDWRVANLFVIASLKSLHIEFVEDCFQNAPDPRVMAHLLSNNSLVVSSDETLKRITKHILEFGANDFTSLFKKLKKVGYTELLHTLAVECKEALADNNQSKVQIYTNAVILLVLTSNVDDFFSTVDPLLPSITQVDANEMAGDSTKPGEYCPLEATKQGDAICNGFGRAISHVGVPALAVQRLQKFCVNGDLMLFVRDALYSVCCSLPNDKAQALLLSLMKQPVSVKKHALRLLSRTVCNIETQEVLLSKFMELEKHSTMRIILVSTAIASLNVSREVSMWQVVKAVINKLTPDDDAIVKGILDKTLPDLFLEEYYLILWEKCKTLKNSVMTETISTLAHKVLEFETVLSEKFVEHFISELFLSKLFFSDIGKYFHAPISNLFLLYLQGATGSKLPAKQCEPRRTIEERQKFLKEKLDAYAIDGPCDIFDSAQGVYPIRRLLNSFIESFCESCLGVNSKKPYEYQLTEYIDFLLSYFDQFNNNSLLSLYTMLSSTKILKLIASESAFVVGKKLGELCDSMFRKNSVTLFCLPVYIAKFFRIVNRFSLLSSSQSLDVYRGIISTLPPGSGGGYSPDDLCNMLLLLIVAQILPYDWLVDDDYKEFRQTFFVLIKNTPAEQYLFGKGEMTWY